MQTNICFKFSRTVPLAELEGTLLLSRIATEAIHGEERVELEEHPAVDRQAKTVAIDTSSDVGRTLALIFTGYVRREFGTDAVVIERGDDDAGGTEILTGAPALRGGLAR